MSDSEFNKDNSNLDDVQDEFTLIKNSLAYKQKERRIRKQKKRRNKLKGLLRFLTLLLIVYLGYYIWRLPQWYLPQDTFEHASKYVQVINNDIVPKSAVYDAIKDIQTPKVPIFLFSPNVVSKSLYKNIPALKKVYIRRYGFPARIQIIVTERIPTAIIKRDLKSQPSAFYTSDGVLITSKKYMKISDKDTLKIIMNTNNLEKSITKEKIENIKDIVDAVETYSNEKVEYIDLRKENDVYVKIKTINIRLGVLDSTVFERIKRIYTILPQIKNMNTQIKYIDLSWDKVNYLKLNKKEK